MNALLNTAATPPIADCGKADTPFTPAAMVPNAMLRLVDTCAVTGMAGPTLYEAIRKGVFVSPVKVTGKSSAWPASEVNAILAARIAGKTDDEIRALVVELTAARKRCA